GERRADAIHTCHERGWISGTPRRDLYRKVASACSPHGVDNLEYRSAAPVTAVECRAGAAATQIGKRRRMSLNQVADMNVVADAGAVGGRIVSAEHLQLRTLADGCLAGDLYQVRRSCSRLTGAHPGIRPRDIEVAQNNEAQAICLCRVAQHDLR